MACPGRKGLKGAEDEAWLPGDLQNSVPVPVGDGLVGAGNPSIGHDQLRAVSDRSCLTARQARDRVSTCYGLSRNLTAQPGRTAQHQYLHAAKYTSPLWCREPGVLDAGVP